jgi:hypothetical protein
MSGTFFPDIRSRKAAALDIDAGLDEPAGRIDPDAGEKEVPELMPPNCCRRSIVGGGAMPIPAA